MTVQLNLAAKYTLTVADYKGARAGSVVSAKFAETATQATHATPQVTVPAGAWVVSHWADKSSLTTGFTLPPGVTSRAALCGASTGRVCSVLADSDGPAPTGSYGPLTATADSASNNATTWSVVLRTDDPNVPPQATFTQTCASTVCSFDASASSDPDGAVASYAWDFGDGATAVGVSPQHDFVTSGSRDVTVTVTDDEGATASMTTTVSVIRTNTVPVPAFTSSCAFLDCSFDGSGSNDPDGSIASYAWDFGDGTLGSGAAPHHVFTAGGSYQVALTVTDNDGAA